MPSPYPPTPTVSDLGWGSGAQRLIVAVVVTEVGIAVGHAGDIVRIGPVEKPHRIEERKQSRPLSLA